MVWLFVGVGVFLLLSAVVLYWGMATGVISDDNRVAKAALPLLVIAAYAAKGLAWAISSKKKEPAPSPSIDAHTKSIIARTEIVETAIEAADKTRYAAEEEVEKILSANHKPKEILDEFNRITD